MRKQLIDICTIAINYLVFSYVVKIRMELVDVMIVEKSDWHILQRLLAYVFNMELQLEEGAFFERVKQTENKDKACT